jgi:putative pyruvate formate lyase activating enzyme
MEAATAGEEAGRISCRLYNRVVPMEFQAAYRKLPPGELRRRAEAALAVLSECFLCPRQCHAGRLDGRTGTCGVGRNAIVSSFGPHHGEEDCLRGTHGSGTIFFASCNLRCIFCQNFDVSAGTAGGEMPAEALAGVMLELQRQGCHNINLVTPSHVVPQILEALAVAAEAGLRLPLVYNTSGYDTLDALAFLDGVVDIFMPDFKFWDAERARQYCQAPDYPEVARRALKEMHRQVGALALDAQGVARRGMLLRHLVMPNGAAGTRQIMAWVARELGPQTYVNIMPQYWPAGRVGGGDFVEIDRGISAAEFRQALRDAHDAGLHRLDPRSQRRAG